MRRVVIVDDNEITRTGTERLLGDDPEVEVIAAVDHATALGWRDEWHAADVVIVDAADERRHGDQFPGVEVVRRVRAQIGNPRPVVVVLTGHFLDDALRRRMAEADADFFYSRTEVATGDALRTVVLAPDQSRRVPHPADPAALRALGVVDTSDLNAYVRYVEGHGLGEVFSTDARMKQGPHASRSRWWQQLRRSLAATGRIQPVNVGGSPPLGQAVPSITQLRRLYEWASKTKPPQR